MGKIWNLLKQTFKEWNEDKAPRLAAALAYYTVFSIPPLLVIVISIAGFFFGRSNAQGAILQQVSNLVGPQGADAISTILKSTSGPGGGLFATLTGIVLLLLGASGVFGQLQDALNTIWEVQPRPGLGIGAMIRKRFFTFTMVMGMGFLLLVSMVVSTFLAALGNVVRGLLPGTNLIVQIINVLVSFLIITLLFALTYRYVPDARIAWKDVWLGAAVTALLFTIGKQLIGIYLGNSNVGSTFGVFASLIVLLVWVYYSAQILLFGAEFTQVYANLYGSHVVPEKNAEMVTEEVRANEGIPHQDVLKKEARPERERRPAPQANAEILSQPSRAEGVSGAGVTSEAVPTVRLPPTHPEIRSNNWRLLVAAYPTLLAFVIGVVGSVIIARTPPASVQRQIEASRKAAKKEKKRRRRLLFF